MKTDFCIQFDIILLSILELVLYIIQMFSLLHS